MSFVGASTVFVDRLRLTGTDGSTDGTLVITATYGKVSRLWPRPIIVTRH